MSTGLTAGQRQVLKQEKVFYMRHPELKQSRRCRRNRGILPAWLVIALEKRKISKSCLDGTLDELIPD